MTYTDMNTGSAYFKVRFGYWHEVIGDYPNTKLRLRYDWRVVSKVNHWSAFDCNFTFTVNGSSRSIYSGYTRLEAYQVSRVLHSGYYDYNWGTHPDTSVAPNASFNCTANIAGVLGSGSVKPTYNASIPRPSTPPTPTNVTIPGIFPSNNTISIKATTDPHSNPHGFYVTKLVVDSSSSTNMTANQISRVYNTRTTTDAWDQTVNVTASDMGHSRYYAASVATYFRCDDTWISQSSRSSPVWVAEAMPWVTNKSARFFLSGNDVKMDISYNVVNNTYGGYKFEFVVRDSPYSNGGSGTESTCGNFEGTGSASVKNVSLGGKYERYWNCWVRGRRKSDNAIIYESSWVVDSWSFVAAPSAGTALVHNYEFWINEAGTVTCRVDFTPQRTVGHYHSYVTVSKFDASSGTSGRVSFDSTKRVTTDTRTTDTFVIPNSASIEDGRWWAMYVVTARKSDNEWQSGTGWNMGQPYKQLFRPVSQAVMYAYDPETKTYKAGYVYAERYGKFEPVAEVWAERNGVFSKTGE